MPSFGSETVTFPSTTVDMRNAANVHFKTGSVTSGALSIPPILPVTCSFDLAIAETPAAHEEVVLVARAAGTFHHFYAGLVDTGTTTDVDFDAKLNGTTILSAVVNVTHSDTDRQNKAGTLSTTTFSQGDIISFSLAVTSTTGAQGPFGVLGIEYSGTPS